MASNVYWSRASINSPSPSHGFLSLNKRLAHMHRSSSSYWSIGKSIAPIGTARVSHVSNASIFQIANTRRFSSPTEARAKRQNFDRVRISLLDYYQLIATLLDSISAFVKATNTVIGRHCVCPRVHGHKARCQGLPPKIYSTKAYFYSSSIEAS